MPSLLFPISYFPLLPSSSLLLLLTPSDLPYFPILSLSQIVHPSISFHPLPNLFFSPLHPTSHLLLPFLYFFAYAVSLIYYPYPYFHLSHTIFTTAFPSLCNLPPLPFFLLLFFLPSPTRISSSYRLFQFFLSHLLCCFSSPLHTNSHHYLSPTTSFFPSSQFVNPHRLYPVL